MFAAGTLWVPLPELVRGEHWVRMAAAELLDVGAIVERAIELPPEPAEREHMRRVSMDLICVAQVPSAAGEVHRC